jgi:Beta-propeller repeat
VIYQQVDGARRQVRGRYLLHGAGQVGFALAGYDTTLPLVIDPVISYSTHLGGSGDDEPIWSDIDRAGNFYVTGLTNSLDFPTTRGVFQRTFGGGEGDAFVAKLNRSGSGLVWSTYLGGDAFDVAVGLDVDRRGNVVVTGETTSTGFPTTPGAFQPSFGGGPGDGFVTKSTPRAPGWSTRPSSAARAPTAPTTGSWTRQATSTSTASPTPPTSPPPRERSSPPTAAGRSTPGPPS